MKENHVTCIVQVVMNVLNVLTVSVNVHRWNMTVPIVSALSQRSDALLVPIVSVKIMNLNVQTVTVDSYHVNVPNLNVQNFQTIGMRHSLPATGLALLPDIMLMV